MNYAVISSGGKQYVAAVGKVITVDKIDSSVGKNVGFKDILLLRTDDELQLGTPLIKGYEVTGKVLKQYKGDKIEVRKFKAKVRYRRKIGFRPMLTDIEIKSVKKS